MPDDIPPLAPGLYLVATPIGNLGDITLRALDVLRSVDRIACEDTRQTQKLLNHFHIEKKTVSCHEHNELSRASELIHEIKRGSAVALVSDAGTPAVSDPGSRLVHEAIAAGVPVIPIPGANAAVTSLVASGLPTVEFQFLGFLPEKAGTRRTFLEKLAAMPRVTPQTIIFYEAPHRIRQTLSDIHALLGECQICVGREITKVHEEFIRGTVAEVRSTLAVRDRIRGEITLLIEAPALSGLSAGKPALSGAAEKISDQITRLKSESGIDEKEALKRLARELDRSKSDLYRELQRERAAKR